MKLQLFLLFFWITCSGLGASPPNLVVILVDDMGWRDTGFSGNPTIQTPNLDWLARHGFTYSRAYAAAPNCAPTRACLMTGQYTPRHGVFTVVDERHSPGQPNHPILAAKSRVELATEAITVAEVLQDAGYATALVGMWNLGRGRRGPFVPTSQGFDLYLEPKSLGFERDAYFRQDGEYLTDCLTDEAITFANQQKDPFFLYLAYHAVHSPFDPKLEILANYGSGEAARYAATIEALDQNIGRLVLSLPENTIILFTSDNGGNWPYVEPLRGGKGSLYEGGLRVPALVYGPGIPKGRQSDVPISTIDLFPTLLDLAGLPLPEGIPIDGLSLKPLWNGQYLDRDQLFFHFPCYVGSGVPSSAMLKGNYKLIEFFETGEVELYDLESDPGESRNLAKKQKALAAELHRELMDWQAAVQAPRPSEPNPNFDRSAVKKKGREQRGKGNTNR
jgi:arylsulfatase A